MKQELEFEAELKFIEAEQTVPGYNKESRNETHQRQHRIDKHEISKAALPIIGTHESAILNGNAFVQRILDLVQALPADLITFDGNPRKFHLFLKAFDSAVHARSFDNCVKLTCLAKYCSGEPKSLVESFMVLEPTLPTG